VSSTQELVNLVFDRGGSLWLAKDVNNKPVVRHRRAPKRVIEALRALPVEEVIQAVEVQEQELQTAVAWFFENLAPVTGAQTMLDPLLRNYAEFCQSRGESAKARYAKQVLRPHMNEAGAVVSFMLVEDFVEICCRERRSAPNRFQKGDMVRCDHYKSYPRLVVLNIRDSDLVVKRPSDAHVFWVCASDCELIEAVENRLRVQ
jgi:hypothetical protein